MRLPVTLISISLLLSACAGVSPASLVPAASGKTITINSPIDYDEYYRIAGSRFYYTIAAGTYRARYEDNRGVYYEGDGACFTIRIEADSLKGSGRPQPTPHGYPCGIYIQNDDSVDPKLYFYKDPKVSEEILGKADAQVVDKNGVPVFTPTTVVGTTVAMAAVRAIDQAELKNLHFYQDQPKKGEIRKAMQ